MRSIIISVAVLASSLMLSSATLADETGNRYIQVSGEGIIQAMPDYLRVNLNVSATAANLKLAKQQTDLAMKSLLKTTESLNIAEKDIDAAQIRNYPQYDWVNNRREYRGEQVTRDVSITLRDKDQYAELAHQLLMIEEVQIHGSELKFNNLQALENQALAKAVKAAKQKARLMARAAGGKLGDVLSIQEQGNHSPQPVYAMARMEKVSMDSEPAPMLIQSQTIQAAVVSRYQVSE